METRVYFRKSNDSKIPGFVFPLSYRSVPMVNQDEYGGIFELDSTSLVPFAELEVPEPVPQIKLLR